MELPPRDFKSLASTCFAIRAGGQRPRDGLQARDRNMRLRENGAGNAPFVGDLSQATALSMGMHGRAYCARRIVDVGPGISTQVLRPERLCSSRAASRANWMAGPSRN